MENKAKNKAEELYDLFRPKFFGHGAYKSLAKQCALICVEESITTLESLLMETYQGYYIKEIAQKRDFMKEVRTELNKMK